MPAKNTEEKQEEQGVGKLTEKDTSDSKESKLSSLDADKDVAAESKKQQEDEGIISIESMKASQDISKGPVANNLETGTNISEKTNTLNSSEIKIQGGGEVPKRGKKKVYIVGVVITALILGSVGGVLFFRINQSRQILSEKLDIKKGNQDGDEQDSSEVSGDDQDENFGLMVVEAENIERSEITLEILNGTDIVGLAGRTADTFEKLGYEIEKIDNAEDVESNQIYVNPEYDGKLGVLLEDVEKELGITSVSGDLTNSSASARIILGE